MVPIPTRWLVMLVLALGSPLLAKPSSRPWQEPEPPSAALPPSAPLSDLQMSLVAGGSGGCYGRCTRYQVTVEGTGRVRFDDFGEEPRMPSRERDIGPERAVALLNRFLKSTFETASARYEGARHAVREGDRVIIGRGGGADGDVWDLSLQIGGYRKAVHLYLGYPADLGELRDVMIQVGGPSAWPKD